MLENWLKKVNPELTSAISDLSIESIGRSIHIHKTIFPSIEDCKIVLLSDQASHMDAIRVQFYEMYHHFDNLMIADLGDIRNNDSNFLISLFTELISSGHIPVILSENKELIHAFHYALNAFHEPFTSSHCGKRLAFYSSDDYANCKHVLSIGTQSHLNAPSDLSTREFIRVGEIKSKIIEAEPFLRNSDTICLDLNIIRQADIPGCPDGSPSGINSEEATQLFRYFGFNDKLKALFIHNYHSDYDFNMQSAQLIAQGIWYFCEAINHCQMENINSNEDFHEFLVDIDGLDEPLTFIKAKKTGRWWMKDHAEEKLIPCSYSDYQTACKNEIPDKLINTEFLL